MDDLTFALTGKKLIHGGLVAMLLLGILVRARQSRHIPLMAVASSGIFLLFTYVVVELSIRPHSPLPSRSELFIGLLMAHVVTGVLGIFGLAFQAMTGAMMAASNQPGPKLRRRHRRGAYFTFCLNALSFVCVIPI